MTEKNSDQPENANYDLIKLLQITTDIERSDIALVLDETLEQAMCILDSVKPCDTQEVKTEINSESISNEEKIQAIDNYIEKLKQVLEEAENEKIKNIDLHKHSALRYITDNLRMKIRYAQSVRDWLKHNTIFELPPEQIENLLNKLQRRFEDNPKRHKGVDWERVRNSILANPRALQSINEMEKAGHEPDVYFDIDEGFYIGTCSKESPEQHRNIAYDAEEVELINTKYPDMKVNGSAVEIAEAMGIDLMERDQYRLVRGKYDLDSYSILKTPSYLRQKGYKITETGRPGINVTLCRIGYISLNEGFRGSLFVRWVS